MRILVTGGNGFIGRTLVRHLVGRGDTVLALGRNRCQTAGAENLQVQALIPSCIEPALRDRAFDAVIHLASAGVHPSDRDPGVLAAINTELPAYIVMTAAKAGAKAVVVAGSSAEYAPLPGRELIDEHAAPETERPYGASKAAGSARAILAGEQHGIPVGVARLFNVFGPGEAPHRLLPALIEGLARGGVVPLSSGTQIRDFIHVDDAADGLITMIERLAAGLMTSGPYNVCTGAGTSVRHFAQAAARELGADESRLAFGAMPLRPEEIEWVVGDPSRLREACGWRARHALEPAIAAAVGAMAGQPR